MAAPDLRSFLQVGFDILKTTVDATTKKILAQLGNAHASTVDANGAEWWQHVGFASRPPKPEAKRRAAQAVVLRAGDHDIIIATQDLRGLDLYGNLADGETCIYAPGEDGEGQARILLKKDGSINLFTKEDNDSGGTGMGIFVNVDGSISLVSHTGAALAIGSDGSVKLFNANGALQIAADGKVKISGSKVSISAPAIVLGGATAGAVVTSVDLTALNALIATAVSGAGPTGPAAAATFTTAAAALVAGLSTTKRTTAD